MQMSTRSRSHYLAVAVAAMAVLLSGSAQAVSIGLSTVPPTPGTLFVGSSLFVAVDVSGLTAGTFPSVTAIELDIGFDASKLSFVGGSFLPVAGFGLSSCAPVPFDPLCEAIVDLSVGPGSVTLAATSLLAPAVIDADQPAAAAIAVLEFLAIMEGSSTLSFTGVSVAGTSATGEVPLAATTSGLGILVNVPEPGTALLLSLGLLGLTATRRRRG